MTAIRGDQRGGPTSAKTGAGRGYGLRQWQNDDIVPRPDDVFQERLYCVRWRLPRLDEALWAEQDARASSACKATGIAASATSEVMLATLPEWVDRECATDALVALLTADGRCEVAELRRRDWRAEEHALVEAQREFETRKAAGRPKRELAAATRRTQRLRETITQRNERVKALANSLPKTLYRSVDEADLEREAHALTLLRERFAEWQTLGYIPSRAIAPGAKTRLTRLMRDARLDALASPVYAETVIDPWQAGRGFYDGRVFYRGDGRMCTWSRASGRLEQ